MPATREGTKSVTAETFAVEIVHLVRLHQIHTVTLCCPTEELRVEAAALPMASTITVEARLLSSLDWNCDTAKNCTFDAVLAKSNGTVFTYHILFATAVTSRDCAGAAISERQGTQLSAHWCSQLQRRLAICSALTGVPSHLSVLLLPYVPHLSWNRDRDGILGAIHSATMMSTVTARDLDDNDTSEARYDVRVAALLNAAVPLGPRVGYHTVALFLNAIDGDACFREALSPNNLRESRKRVRQSQKGCIKPGKDTSFCFPLLAGFNEKYLLPALSWGALHASTLEGKGNHYDVCGLGKDMGCSVYLRGTLDALRVRSVTVIVDGPRDLWYRVISPYGDTAAPVASMKPSLLQLAGKLAETVEAALCRLVAENSDSFVHRAMVSPSREDGAASVAAGPEIEVGTIVPIGQSCPLLIQSIADSLAHIVRTSQNPLFVADVQRLLQLHLMEGDTPSHVMELNADGGVVAESRGDAATQSSVGSTAAALQWAVETRLLKL